MTKRCTSCDESKPLDEFYPRPIGIGKTLVTQRSAHCKLCQNQKVKEYRSTRKDQVRNWSRRQTLRQYGLTPEEYDELLEAQASCCAICERQPSLFHVDHCHESGAVRGLLCPTCNVGLGSFKDNIDWLQKAIKYLCQTNPS